METEGLSCVTIHRLSPWLLIFYLRIRSRESGVKDIPYDIFYSKFHWFFSLKSCFNVCLGYKFEYPEILLQWNFFDEIKKNSNPRNEVRLQQVLWLGWISYVSWFGYEKEIEKLSKSFSFTNFHPKWSQFLKSFRNSAKLIKAIICL